MKNRFESRKTLNSQIGPGGGFNLNIGGVKQPVNVSSTGPTGSGAVSSISAIEGGFTNGANLSTSGRILGALDLVRDPLKNAA